MVKGKTPGFVKERVGDVNRTLPEGLKTCTLFPEALATHTLPESVLKASALGPFVPGLATVLKREPGPPFAGKRTRVVPVSLAPILETRMSPAFKLPGVLDAGMPGGTIATPYGLASTAVVLPLASRIKAVLPTTDSLDSPSMVVTGPLLALMACVVVCVMNNGDNARASTSAPIPKLTIAASLFRFPMSILLCRFYKVSSCTTCLSEILRLATYPSMKK